jgi:LuxR family maltose regulon positive regulatory protein
MARLRQAQGDGRGAMTALDELAALARKREFVAQVSAYIAGARARLWLMQGDRVAAERWALTCGLAPEEPVSFSREMEYGVLARVLLNQKDPRVATVLARLLADAERCGRVGSVVELLALTSLAWHALGDRARAFADLARALALGEPEGYVRVFVDEAAPMAALLRRARVQGIAPEYCGRLLAALGEPAGHRGAMPSTSDAARSTQARDDAPAAFIEPLTDREREVLRLLISGASNQEIAHTLTVTLGTVKQHVHRIFGKFGVRSRTQAILRAKTLSLD